MRFRECLAAWLLVLAPLVAQSRPEGGARFLRGRVVDEENRPVPKSRVLVLEWKPFKRLTVDGDQVIGAPAKSVACKDGKFEVETTGLGPLCTVIAMAASGSPEVVERVFAGDSNVLLKLHTGLTLEGRVVDPDGKGVPGATVRFFARLEGANLTRAVAAAADGRYRLAALPWLPNDLAGDYVAVVVSAPGFATQRWSVAWSQENPSASTGDRVWTLDVPLSRGSTLSGVVRNAAGQAIAGAKVVAWGSVDDIHGNEIDLTSDCPQRLVVAQAVSKEDGGYELRNVPLARRTNRFSSEHEWLGTLRDGAQKRFHGGILVHAPDCDPVMLELPCADREGAVLQQDVTLGPALRITGRVTDAAGQPVAGVRVRARMDRGPMVTELLFDRGDGDRCCEQRTGADGRYAFVGLPERAGAKTEVTLWTEHETKESRSQTIVVEGTGAFAEVPDLVFEDDASLCPFRGIVEDDRGAPVFGAHVTWLHPQYGYSLYSGRSYQAITDASGGFKLAAPENGWILGASAPGKATTILKDLTVSPDGVRVKLVPAVPRGGVVLDSRGKPVEHARVWVSSEAPVRRIEWLRTDRKGAFRIDDLAADATGELDISAPIPVGSPVEAKKMELDWIGKKEKKPLEPLTKNASYKMDWSAVPAGIILNIKVLDEKDGSPVEGPLEATLFLDRKARKDPDADPLDADYRDSLRDVCQTGPGRMRSRGLVAGEHTWTLHAPGYKGLKFAPMPVKPAPPVQEASVRLARGMVLAGKVRLAAPRPGRGMLVVRATNDEITSTTFECCPAADGSFRIPVPWYGYTVSAFVREPDGRRLMQSVTYRLQAGAAEIQNLDLEVRPTVFLKLEVDQKLQEGDASVLIRIRDAKGKLWFERRSLEANIYQEGGSENAFVVGIPEGEYVIQLLDWRGRETRILKTLKATAPGTVALTPP